MIYHMARMRYQDAVPQQERDIFEQHLRGLADLDSVVEVGVGVDVGDPQEGSEGNFDLSVLVKIPDMDAYERYQREPLHTAMLHYMMPRIATAMICDFTDDPGGRELRNAMLGAVVDAARERGDYEELFGGGAGQVSVGE